ncbi:MAG TPA: GNAT family N-acetyltransferase, partial [Thermoanaerobaculia bacterium]
PLEGQGIASELVRSALDYARSNGVRVVPTCSYVRSWLSRHEGYEDVVA